MTAERKIDCRHAQDVLDEFRRNELSPEHMKQVKQHLDECDLCMADLHYRETLATDLRASIPAFEMPVDLSPAVIAAMSGRRHKLSQNSKRMPLIPWVFTASVVIIFLVAFLKNQPRTPLIAARNVASVGSDNNIHVHEELKQGPVPGPAAGATSFPHENTADGVVKTERYNANISHADLPVTKPAPDAQPDNMKKQTASDLVSRDSINDELNAAGAPLAHRTLSPDWNLKSKEQPAASKPIISSTRINEVLSADGSPQIAPAKIQERKATVVSPNSADKTYDSQQSRGFSRIKSAKDAGLADGSGFAFTTTKSLATTAATAITTAFTPITTGTKQILPGTNQP